MDFGVPDEIQSLLKGVRDFIEREVRTLEREHWDLVSEGVVTPELYELARRVSRKSAEAGYYGLGMPEDVGGAGIGELGMCFVREEVARSGAILALNMLGDLPFGPNRMLYELGTPEQRERYLMPLMRAEKTTAIALSEPEAGSDLAGVRTFARRDGDRWILRGGKHFITNGPYADFLMVLAQSEGGYSFFLIDRDTPGFSVGRIQRTMGGDDLQSEVYFDDAPVPAGNLIGDEGKAFEYAMRFLAIERLAMASTAIGIADLLVELSMRHAKNRVQFGRPIGSNQAIQWMIADSLTEIYAARMMSYDAAWRADQGEDVFQKVSMTKLFATEMTGRVADRAMQIHGGVGYMRGPVERFYRLARVLRIGGGTSEIQRMIIARGAGL